MMALLLTPQSLSFELMARNNPNPSSRNASPKRLTFHA
jgi:hypothetical protein